MKQLVLLFATLFLALPTSVYAEEENAHSPIFKLTGKAEASSEEVIFTPSPLYIPIGERARLQCELSRNSLPPNFDDTMIESSNPEIANCDNIIIAEIDRPDGRVRLDMYPVAVNRGVCTFTFHLANGASAKLVVRVMGKEEFEYSNVCIDGIYYDFYPAEVVKAPAGIEPYKGDIIIPSQVKWYGWTYSIKSIGEDAFASCDVSSVRLPVSLKRIKERSFMQSKLTYIDILNEVDSIGESAFKDCASLESVYLGKMVNTIGLGAFAGCSKLKQFYISDDNTAFSLNEGGIYNKGLTKLILYPNGKTSVSIPATVKTIGAGSFMGNKSIDRIDFPTNLETIEDYACSGCTALSQVIVPDNVTSIGDFAFSECPDIWKIRLGKDLVTIGKNAFGNSQFVSEIHIDNILPPLISETSFANYDATLYVPVGRKNSYAHASVWSNFKNIVESNFSGVEKIGTEDVEPLGDIYNLQGILIRRNASRADIHSLPAGMYLIGGKKMIRR